jgi:hypothetical protein
VQGYPDSKFNCCRGKPLTVGKVKRTVSLRSVGPIFGFEKNDKVTQTNTHREYLNRVLYYNNRTFYQLCYENLFFMSWLLKHEIIIIIKEY